ncbi:lipopolysaccharide biosynthesis protein [Methyloglobulus sp.]|uniref:GumC family protein n=1 Tax=Methyloglobulus sp. TaxID=2518622 RepID=UPI0032B80206
MEKNAKTLTDYLYLAKRRKYYIVVTWLLVSIISIIVAYFIPKTYRSTATVLIEAPLPTKLFESTASQYADEQIQSVYQRLMTTDNVFSIIESNGLYDDIKNDYTRHELADFFRDSAEVELAASSLTPKTNSGMAEIAFNISFSDSDATTAKDIVSNLVALFIEQNDKSRTQRAIKATDFLMEESNKLNRDLQDIDNKIVKYKEQNNFSLPEQAQGNLAGIDRAENELRDTDSQIRATKERIAFLTSELARAQEILPGKLDDKAPQSKDEALRTLRVQYLQLSSIYSPSHPSVIRLKREIKMLDPTFVGQSDEKHIPNQLAGRKQIDSLDQQLPGSQIEDKDVNSHNTNPAYLGVEAQYKSSQSELQSLMQKQDYLKAKLEKMHNLLSLAPQVEKGYNDLIRARDNTTKKYTQLKEKWLDAKLVQTQEEQQQGQTLTVIEQPVIPTHPEKAIRRKVAIGGFFLGLFAGIGLAFLVEFLDPRLTGYRAIAEATGLMPIVVLPYIETPSEENNKIAKQRKEKKIVACTIVMGIFLAIAAIFYFFAPFVYS